MFGPDADQPPDIAVVHEKFAALAAEVGRATGVARTPEQIAHGCLAIAVDNMANAIKRISIQRGHDIGGYVLCCFGGAAGQHACLVADSLGLERILVHPLASVLSAYGMGLADVRTLRQRAIEATLDAALMPRLAETIDDLGAEGRAELEQQGVATGPDRAPSRASTSATAAPTRRSRSPMAASTRCAARSRPSTARATASSSRGGRWSSSR